MATLETWVRRDRAIEKEANGATLRLMENRWKACQEHSIGAYARALDRHQGTISTYVRAWELRESDLAAGCTPRTSSDYLELAKTAGVKQEALVAVAEAKGISLVTARQHHKDDVQDTERVIKEHAERRQRATPEERERMDEPAEHGRKHAAVRERRRSHEKAARKEKFLGMPKYLSDLLSALSKVRVDLKYALKYAREGEIEPPFNEEAQADLDAIQATLDLLKIVVSGEANIDWDAEMAKLGEEN